MFLIEFQWKYKFFCVCMSLTTSCAIVWLNRKEVSNFALACLDSKKNVNILGIFVTLLLPIF